MVVIVIHNYASLLMQLAMFTMLQVGSVSLGKVCAQCPGPYQQARVWSHREIIFCNADHNPFSPEIVLHGTTSVYSILDPWKC